MNQARMIVGIALMALVAVNASAMRYGFEAITSNSAGNASVGESQLFVDVSMLSADQVLFQFSNNGPDASSITHVYFDDEHMSGLLGIASISGSTGVDFEQPASPVNLPGGENLIPPFSTTFGEDEIAFSADSNLPDQIVNGVNPGESLDVVFELAQTAQISEILVALTSSELRIGIVVQGFESDIDIGLVPLSTQPLGSVESFVNRPVPQAVPDASWTLLLLGAAMVGIETLRRRLKVPTS